MGFNDLSAYDVSMWLDRGMSIQIEPTAFSTEVSESGQGIGKALAHFASAAFVSVGLMISSMATAADISVPFSSLQTPVPSRAFESVDLEAAPDGYYDSLIARLKKSPMLPEPTYNVDLDSFY